MLPEIMTKIGTQNRVMLSNTFAISHSCDGKTELSATHIADTCSAMTANVAIALKKSRYRIRCAIFVGVGEWLLI